MDKLDHLLDFIENPERYTAEEADRLLADPEIRSLYNTIAETSSALYADTDAPDINKEWLIFNRRRLKHHKPKRTHRNVAAILIPLITMTAFAAGLGISLVITKNNNTKTDVSTVTVDKTADSAGNMTAEIIDTDSIRPRPQTIIFENQPLNIIIGQISSNYGLKYGLDSPKSADLRMYLKWNTTAPIEDVANTLNSFEQIEIRLLSDSLSVGIQ